jgi:nicotinic acid mononucleotide adenylyltransferase
MAKLKPQPKPAPEPEISWADMRRKQQALEAEARKRQEEQRARRDARQPGRGIVMAFGRFNPPTKGHAELFARVQDEAGRCNASHIIFASPSQDAKRNPLPHQEKLRFLKLMFPSVNFSANERIRDPFDALHVLSLMGFERIYIVCGSDRTDEFQKIGKYVRPAGRKDGRFIVAKDFGIIPMVRSDMNTMSATVLREAARAGDFDAFRQGIPTQNEGIARQLFTSVRRHMGIKNFKQFVSEAETKPKVPTEVDRMKLQQKSELLQTKARQSNDILQAKKRELENKSREDMVKLADKTSKKS